ncbi:hypothetical protein O181_049902 [Austropuccinia psidii MF-1]|uniref:Uncharacterized protein n=1 Tax=Austropuccinia psidii MF-1 TaxID=1389203 RepID=A0A9Q3DXX4_9BASI|nr:hypothetical protein [Austropuccinia psidii MF-1]
MSEVLRHPESIVRRRGFLVFNLLLLGPPGSNSETLEKEIALRPTIDSQTIPQEYGAESRRVEDLGWKLLLMNPQPLIPPLATPISNLVAHNEVEPDAEGIDELDGEELEMTTPIQKRRIQSTSLSPLQASTTIQEVIQSPQPPQLPTRSPTRPSTLASTSTNVQNPMASTSRDPMSPQPESVFDHCKCWNTTGNFTDQKKVNKKVVKHLSKELDSLTEAFVDKAIKSSVPGEATRALTREEVSYEDALVVKFRESLKKL